MMRQTIKRGFCLCVASVLACGQMVFAESKAITAEQALAIAQQSVPQTCTHLTTDVEKYKYEVKFYDKTEQKKYEVEVGKSTGDILEFSVESAKDQGGSSIKLDAEAAKAVIKRLYPDIVTITAELDEDDGLYSYEIDYASPAIRGEAEVNAETGAIMERSDTYIQAKNTASNGIAKPSSNTASGLISQGGLDVEKAAARALQEVPGGVIRKIELVGNGSLYEVTLQKGDYEYEVLLNASTGARIGLSTDYDPVDFDDDWYQNPGSVQKPSSQSGLGTSSSSSAASSSELISRDRAKQIAQRCAPSGAKFKSMSLTRKDGVQVYNCWLKLDGMRYAFQIDARTGSVVASDIQSDPNWKPGHHDANEEEYDDDFDVEFDDDDYAEFDDD